MSYELRYHHNVLSLNTIIYIYILYIYSIFNKMLFYSKKCAAKTNTIYSSFMDSTSRNIQWLAWWPIGCFPNCIAASTYVFYPHFLSFILFFLHSVITKCIVLPSPCSPQACHDAVLESTLLWTVSHSSWTPYLGNVLHSIGRKLSPVLFEGSS